VGERGLLGQTKLSIWVATTSPFTFALKDSGWRKRFVHIMIVVHRQCDLFHVVAALTSPRRFASRLHCGKQQGNENPDDGYHH
jgi:hypothetical protein